MHGVGLDDLQSKMNVALADGTCLGEVPEWESLGWEYYSKLRAKFNELRCWIESYLLKPMPKSFEGWIDEVRFWGTSTVEYSRAVASINAASSKGAYVTNSKLGGKYGSELRCRTQNTSEHKGIDDVCKALRATESEHATSGAQNGQNQQRKGSNDASEKPGDGKGSTKYSGIAGNQEQRKNVISICVRDDVYDNLVDSNGNTKNGQEFRVFVPTLCSNENFILEEVSEGIGDHRSTSNVRIRGSSQKLAILHVHLGGQKQSYGENVTGLDIMAGISISRRNLMPDESACEPLVVKGVKKESSPIYISKVGYISYLGVRLHKG